MMLCISVHGSAGMYTLQSHRTRRHPCYATAAAQGNALDLAEHESLAKAFDLKWSISQLIETTCSTLACVDHSICILATLT